VSFRRFTGAPRYWGATGLALLLALAAGWAFLPLWADAPWDRLRPEPATAVLDCDGRPLRVFLPPDGQFRLPVRLHEVSPVLVKTLVASEDRFFGRHPGVNPLAGLRACWSNLRAGRVVSGASTIPMQLARLLDPKPRTLKAKILEAARALVLCRRLSDEQVLEAYLNLLPFGGNVVGVRAASWAYFGKEPAALSLAEAALLTALPRSPQAYDPQKRPQAAREARNRVLEQLAARGAVSASEAEEAASRPLPEGRRPLPFRAPHFCSLARSRLGAKGELRTSLDLQAQSLVEAVLLSRSDWLHGQGLDNAAAIVLDVETREVLAMAGAIDFFDEARHGQVDAALAAHSPGSALKPFLYAQAMDRGLIAPESYLLDLPVNYSGYAPVNYDRQYRGRVTARQALLSSLNVPAVRLLASLGHENFYDLLKPVLGLSGGPGRYGLTLALGGAEVSLLDLTALYAALAAEGLWLPPRLSPNPADAPPLRRFSPEAAFLAREILTQVERPDQNDSWGLSRTSLDIAWKTGTSFGHRDAWAVGFSGRHAVGVWTGNVDGRPSPGISGTRHAGPMLFDIFRALEPLGSQLPERLGLNLGQATLCAESRQLAGPFCPATINATIIPGRTVLSRCPVHRQIFVDTETGERLEGDCLLRRPHRQEVAAVHQVELENFWRENGLGSGVGLPPLSALCRESLAVGGPRIVSPTARTPYRLRPDAPDEFQRVALAAQSGPEARALYWYEDGSLAASGPPDSPLFLRLVRGKHRLLVQDDLGRTDALDFLVE